VWFFCLVSKQGLMLARGWLGGGSGVEGEIIKALGVFFWFSFKRLRGS